VLIKGWQNSCGTIKQQLSMKKLFILAGTAFLFACNQSGPQGMAPGDTDHTGNHDTMPLVKTDSSKAVIPEKRVDTNDKLLDSIDKTKGKR
jgi:hypothetical protein